MPQAPRGGLSRHTRSGKPYKHEHGRKYWHYFLRMDNHPTGWPLLYETPLGMICRKSNDKYATLFSTPKSRTQEGRHSRQSQASTKDSRFSPHISNFMRLQNQCLYLFESSVTRSWEFSQLLGFSVILWEIPKTHKSLGIQAPKSEFHP